MALLLTGAEIVQPGWWRLFARAVAQYRQYTQSQSVLEVLLNLVLGSSAGRVGAQVLATLAVLACGLVLWKSRAQPADLPGFSRATALVLALTVLVVPMFAPYNQILLLPAIFLLVRERAAFLSRSRVRRLAYQGCALVIVWQWLASIGLTATYWLASREAALAGWTYPLFTTFAVPVWVFALTYFLVKDEVRS
jgi:hypothetical protein